MLSSVFQCVLNIHTNYTLVLYNVFFYKFQFLSNLKENKLRFFLHVVSIGDITKYGSEWPIFGLSPHLIFTFDMIYDIFPAKNQIYQ